MPTMQFAGRFQWWWYTVGHGQLLLRSPFDAVRGTQVDVLFKNVAYVRLLEQLQNLSIAESDGKAEYGDPGRKKVFAVKADGFEGQVVAGAVFHREYVGHHGDPSPLLPEFPPKPSP